MTATKGNGRNAEHAAPAKNQTHFATDFTAPSRFTGTDNPRHLRALQALKNRPLPREQLDHIAGCSNGPDLIAELRRRGLELPCTRTKKMDRDMFDCFPGVYHLTELDRRKIRRWLNKREAAHV